MRPSAATAGPAAPAIPGTTAHRPGRSGRAPGGQPVRALFRHDGLDDFFSGTSRIAAHATILIERDLPVTVVFLPVERFWPLHPDQSTFRPQWTTDLFYFVATHLPAQLMTLLMIIPATYASKWLAIPWLAHTVGSLPFLIQLPLAILVADLSQYATHRAFHRIPLLWRFHAIHHSIETMDWVAGSRSHYVDILLTRGLILVPMTIVGFSQAALAGYLVFVSFHATFCHTDFRPRTIWLERYFVTVRYHHWHHAAHPDAVDVNFAIHLPFTDRVFGTQYLPKDAWPARYGLVGGAVPRGFFRQLLAPFKRDAA